METLGLLFYIWKAGGMADAPVLGSGVKRRTGSSPVPSTTFIFTRVKHVLLWRGDDRHAQIYYEACV